MLLVKPALEHLSSYVDALKRGWTPRPDRPEFVRDALERIEQSPQAFVEGFDDPQGRNGIRLWDGSVAPLIPSIGRWMWDGEFCGGIMLRWMDGTAELPPMWLGHIGYYVVPWKQRRGYATAALAQMLPEAQERRLPHIDVVTTPDNIASQRVILANGGVLIEQFQRLSANGGGTALRYRIALSSYNVR
jgi:predicted acetyltransferase